MSKNMKNDGGFKKEGGVNYDTLMDRQVGDKRFERERNSAGKAAAPVNSTIDTLQRMAAGVEGRTIADKINDANRPTWEQYKKDNEAKLDLVGGEMRKMVEYRAQLDKERDQRLEHGTNRTKKTNAISDSDSDDSDSDSDDSGRHKKKHKKDKKKSKKSKKHKDKKDKKTKRSKHTSSSDEDNSEDRKDGDRDSRKKHKSDTASSSGGGGSYRLSDFMNGGGYSSGEN